ncbi:MAG TPA: alpha/beta fold hydrolase [Bryobacteraceae bacterium]|nr:alpha/beta fold hydrolase [Bryobacteraceae bacterium]
MSVDLTQPRVRTVGSPRGLAQAAGVLLHGRGKTPEEKIDLAARFGNLEGIRWVVPEAETPGSWYPGRFFDPRELNEPYLTEAVERCHAAVFEASENGRLGPDRLVIVGFSQGASLALEYALRHPTTVGSLIVLTGGLMGLPGSNWKTIAPPSLKGLRMLLTGSDVDDWIPEQSTYEAANLFRELGADVQLHIYPGRPHIVSEEEITEARSFLISLIK